VGMPSARRAWMQSSLVIGLAGFATMSFLLASLFGIL